MKSSSTAFCLLGPPLGPPGSSWSLLFSSWSLAQQEPWDLPAGWMPLPAGWMPLPAYRLSTWEHCVPRTRCCQRSLSPGPKSYPVWTLPEDTEGRNLLPEKYLSTICPGKLDSPMSWANPVQVTLHHRQTGISPENEAGAFSLALGIKMGFFFLFISIPHTVPKASNHSPSFVVRVAGE